MITQRGNVKQKQMWLTVDTQVKSALSDIKVLSQLLMNLKAKREEKYYLLVTCRPTPPLSSHFGQNIIFGEG